MVFLSGICFAQVPESEDVEVDDVEPDIYATLVFARPELVIEGLDPMPADNQTLPREVEIEAIQTSNVNRLESIRQYQATINELEFEGGAWEQGLTQELLAMGSLQQQLGSHPAAVEAYTRAMQVSRINYGLDNLEQVSIVEQLINSHLALGQWEKADQYHNYLYYTQKKAYGHDDPRMIPVLDRLASWSLSAFNGGYGEAVGLRLFTAFYSYRAASNIVSMHFGEDDERFVNYLKEMAATAYLVYRNPRLIEVAGQPKYRSVRLMFENENNQYDTINPPGYKDGREALERIVNHYADKEDKQSEFAQALISLADWHLMFDRRRTASGYYQEAINILSGLDQGEELIQDFLGNVEPLPELSQKIRQLPDSTTSGELQAEINYTGVVDVIFDVTIYGGVANLEVLTEETEANSKVLSLLRRKVRNTVFRPSVVEGELVRTSDNHFRYRYWY